MATALWMVHIFLFTIMLPGTVEIVWVRTGFAVIASTSAFAALWVAWRIFGSKSSTGHPYFMFTMLAVAEWSLACAFECIAHSIPEKVFWSQVSYLGVVSVAPSWLLFSLKYGRHDHIPHTRWNVALWIIPLIVLLLAITNGWHHWIWTYVGPLSPSPDQPIVYQHGPMFWVEVAYSYILLFAGMVIFLVAAWQRSEAHLRQASIMLIALLFPWLGDLIYIAGYSPIQGLDFAPIGLAISGILIAWDIEQYGFLGLLPGAQEVLYGSLNDGVVVFDLQGNVTNLNEMARTVLNVDDSTIGGRIQDSMPELQPLLRNPGSGEHPLHALDVEKEGRWYVVRRFVIQRRGSHMAGYILVFHDITARKRAMDDLRTALREKETLLKEVHHRVKNNLNVVASLLSMQSRHAKVKEDELLFEEARHRIIAMARVHERLYRSVSLASIDFEPYARDLVQMLAKAFNRPDVAVSLDVAHIELEPDTAIPLGIIINELVTNCYKYAFPAGRSGVIAVELHILPGGPVQLTVRDDGVGIASRLEESQPDSLGHELVSLLAEQLDGRVVVTADNGTTFTITVPKPT